MTLRSTLLGWAFALATMVLVPGCSSSSENGANSGGESTAGPSPTEPVQTPPSPSAPRLALGAGFAYRDDGSSGDVEVQVTVDRFRCDIKRYGFVASSVSGSIPADAPAVPSTGQQFCQADLSVRNIGKRPLKDGVQPGRDASLNVGGTQYAATDLSQAVVFTYLSNANNSGKSVGWFMGDVINPGQVVHQIQVWEIPAADEPTSIIFESQPDAAPVEVAVS
jgi:hypothetical protein